VIELRMISSAKVSASDVTILGTLLDPVVDVEGTMLASAAHVALHDVGNIASSTLQLNPLAPAATPRISPGQPQSSCPSAPATAGARPSR